MRGGDAGRLQFHLQIEIEVRRIHAHEQRGRVLQEVRGEPPPDAEDLEVVAQHLDVSPHRQLFHGNQHFHPCGLHARPADAGEARMRQASAQGLDEMGAEQVSRRLARDHADGERRLGHEKPGSLSD